MTSLTAPVHAAASTRTYRLVGPEGVPYLSQTPGTLGGHRHLKAYGRLDCPSALAWIAKGYYVAHRVFFADETAAIAAGYRSCARCLPDRYGLWKSGRLVPSPPETRETA